MICDKHGRPVLIDLDIFAAGPREWELIQTALFADRLGWRSAMEYRMFADVYGYDIISWAAYSDLDRGTRRLPKPSSGSKLSAQA